ncbi:hypothetical protein DPEC_G00147490 [Dallia pectoralis]|uniref:Uncharacterized protein n=1 Tax=Dallia pectoralis TaxID=75939 RepID=A0ACC2GIB2_DALPE|nr:hypothetical protein DPEC_G00147490 [Dallia pectoralis]
MGEFHARKCDHLPHVFISVPGHREGYGGGHRGGEYICLAPSAGPPGSMDPKGPRCQASEMPEDPSQPQKSKRSQKMRKFINISTSGKSSNEKVCEEELEGIRQIQ